MEWGEWYSLIFHCTQSTITTMPPKNATAATANKKKKAGAEVTSSSSSATPATAPAPLRVKTTRRRIQLDHSDQLLSQIPANTYRKLRLVAGSMLACQRPDERKMFIDYNDKVRSAQGVDQEISSLLNDFMRDLARTTVSYMSAGKKKRSLITKSILTDSLNTIAKRHQFNPIYT